jgi:predicted RNase H-like HicB family nuclease
MEMNKVVYPAIFHKEEVGGYSVSFPDLPGCFSEGDTLEEAENAAREALELHLYCMERDGEPIPDASDDIDVERGDFVVLISAWMDAVRDEMRNRAVKKTLTIPNWLNDAAESAKINYSQVLQAALMERLGVGKDFPERMKKQPHESRPAYKQE